MRPRLTRARVLAAVVFLLGGALLFLRHAPVSTWAVPVGPGPVADGWSVVETSRSDTRVHLTLQKGSDRHAADVERVLSPPRPEDADRPTTRAGRYRLTADPALPEAVPTALADRLTAWEAQRPRPPPFVRPVGPTPAALQSAEQLGLDLVAWLLITGIVAWWRPITEALPGLGRRAVLGLLGVMGTATALVVVLDTPGVWHANHHGFDRISDLLRSTPSPAANLARLHGQAFYTLHQPLADALATTPGHVYAIAWGLTLLAGALWTVWFRALLGRDARALVAAAVLLLSPLTLRIGPTGSMYVPATLYLALTLVLFEAYLRSDDGRVLWLGLGAMVLLVQSRAEMLLLGPAWVLWRMLTGRPQWLRTGPKRPAVGLGLVVAGLAVAPRLVGFLTTDKPANTSRALLDPVQDPRAFALLGAALAVLAAVPSVDRPVTAWLDRGRGRRGLVGAGLVLSVAAWILAARQRPDGFDPSWHIHPFFGLPDTPAVWWPVLVLIGAVSLRRVARGPMLFLTGAVVLSLAVYLPHHDSLSTYLRTSLTTLPLLAALAALGLQAVTRSVRPALRPILLPSLTAYLVAATIPVSASLLTTRHPKQQQWDLFVRHAADLPEGAVVVWPAPSDLDAEVTRPRFHTQRFDLPRHLRGRARAIPLSAWLDGEAPADAEVFLLATADCRRAVLGRDGVADLGGGRRVPWVYLKAPIASTGHRIHLPDLDPDAPFERPLCAAVRSQATGVIEEVRLHDEVAGSIYEELLGRGPTIGWYRLPSRPEAPVPAEPDGP